MFIIKGRNKKDSDDDDDRGSSRSAKGDDDYSIPDKTDLPDGEYSGMSSVIEASDPIQSGSCSVSFTVRDGKITLCTATLYDEEGTLKDNFYCPQNEDEEFRKRVDEVVEAANTYAGEFMYFTNVDDIDKIEGAEVIYEQFKAAVEDAVKDVPAKEEDTSGEDEVPDDIFGKDESSEDDEKPDEPDKDESSGDDMPVIMPGLEKEKDAEKYAQIVVDNEALWLGDFREFTLYGNTDLTYTGIPNCWFEDVDMDGELEFIFGGFNMGTQGGIGYRIYEFVDGEMKATYPDYGYGVDRDEPLYAGSINSIIRNDTDTSDLTGFKAVHGELLMNENGICRYYFPTIFSYVDAGYSISSLIINRSDNSCSTENIGSYSYPYYLNEDRGPDYLMGSYTGPEDYISREELTEGIKDHFAGLTVVDVNIKAIPCTSFAREVDPLQCGFEYECYEDMSRSDRLEALKESYLAYSNETTGKRSELCDTMLDDLEKIGNGTYDPGY